MPPLMERIERTVLQDRKRAQNRKREHASHGWIEIDRCLHIILMDCPCGWLGWIPVDSI